MCTDVHLSISIDFESLLNQVRSTKQISNPHKHKKRTVSRICTEVCSIRISYHHLRFLRRGVLKIHRIYLSLYFQTGYQNQDQQGGRGGNSKVRAKSND